MNTPLLPGSKAVGVLRAGAAFLALFLLVGLGQSFAQTQDYQIANTLSASSSIGDKNSYSTTAPANVSWLTTEEAASAIKSAVAGLQNVVPSTNAAEVELGVRSAYYSAVLEGITSGTSVADEYGTSFIKLARLAERYPAASRPDLQTIRDNLLDLLSQ